MVDRFEFQSPPKALLGLAKYLWVIEGTASQEQPYLHKALVDGCTQWLFAYRGRFQRCENGGTDNPPLKAAVVAQTTDSLTYRLTEGFGIVGICLYPFAVPYLLGINGTDFINRWFTLENLFGVDGRTLEQEVTCSDTYDSWLPSAFTLLETRLKAYPGSEPPILKTIRDLYHCEEPDDIDALVQPKGLSERQFQRLFKQYTGYTPKHLARILRLQLTLQPKGDPSLSELAARARYYDQSHLSNEFRQLAGTTPKAYFSDRHPETRWRKQGQNVGFFQENEPTERYAGTNSRDGDSDADD